MKINIMPDKNYLSECFYYEDGILFWNVRPLSHFKDLRSYNSWNARFSKKIAGNIGCGGYYVVCVNKQTYFNHRIIWKLFNETDPIEQIDHIDGNVKNNKICNLREASKFQNKHNRRISKNNTSGYKGVIYNKNRNTYIATIMVNNKSIFLGSFNDPKDAHIAYSNAAINYHKEFHNIG